MYLDRFLIARGRNLKQILKMLYTTGSKLPVADPGGVARGTRLPPLFLDQTEARRAEKFFLETAPPSLPSPFSQGLDQALITTCIYSHWY